MDLGLNLGTNSLDIGNYMYWAIPTTINVPLIKVHQCRMRPKMLQRPKIPVITNTCTLVAKSSPLSGSNPQEMLLQSIESQ